MKLSKIELGMKYVGYAPGAIPGIVCEVELTMPNGYSKVVVKLTDDQVQNVVETAVAHAIANLAFDTSSINVKGFAGTPVPEQVDAPLTDEPL